LAALSKGKPFEKNLVRRTKNEHGENIMTKVRFHGPIAGFSGAMGEMVFADNKEKDRTVAYMKTRRPLSEAQLNHRERFSEAAAYAKSALADPIRCELYETVAKERDIPAFSLALGD
jgi:hypothetical protein